MKKRNLPSRSDIIEMMRRQGDSIAAKNGWPVCELRYAEYNHHNGDQWTFTTQWERLVDGQWIEVDVAGELHSTFHS